MKTLSSAVRACSSERKTAVLMFFSCMRKPFAMHGKWFCHAWQMTIHCSGFANRPQWIRKLNAVYSRTDRSGFANSMQCIREQSVVYSQTQCSVFANRPQWIRKLNAVGLDFHCSELIQSSMKVRTGPTSFLNWLLRTSVWL